MKIARFVMIGMLTVLGAVATVPAASAVCASTLVCVDVNSDHCVVDAYQDPQGSHVKAACSYSPLPTVCAAVVNDPNSFTCIVGVGLFDAGCLARVAVIAGPNGEGFTYIGC